MTPERLHALRQYKSGHLDVRAETEISGGGTQAMSYGWRRGPWGWHDHTMVTMNPVITTRTWGVYRGPQRLSVPQFLGAVGQTDLRTQVQSDIDKYRKRGRNRMIVAGVGGAALLTGLVGMGLATDEDSWYTMNLVTLSGSVLGLGGMVGASFPLGKSNRLTRYPSEVVGADEAQRWVDDHNERLRQDLGLAPGDVWRLEARGDAPDR